MTPEVRLLFCYERRSGQLQSVVALCLLRFDSLGFVRREMAMKEC